MLTPNMVQKNRFAPYYVYDFIGKDRQMIATEKSGDHFFLDPIYTPWIPVKYNPVFQIEYIPVYSI